MKKVLFLNDGNGFESHNPYANLVEIPSGITKQEMYELEKHQRGVHHGGGNWRVIMEDGKIPFLTISSGRKSDYDIEKDCDEVYNLISGNY